MTSGGNWPNNQPRTMISSIWYTRIASASSINSRTRNSSPRQVSLPLLFQDPSRYVLLTLEKTTRHIINRRFPGLSFAPQAGLQSFKFICSFSLLFSLYFSFLFFSYIYIFLNATPPTPLLRPEIVPASGPLRKHQNLGPQSLPQRALSHPRPLCAPRTRQEASVYARLAARGLPARAFAASISAHQVGELRDQLLRSRWP